MKKIILSFIFLFSIIFTFSVNGDFTQYKNTSNIDSFINSPSANEIPLIENKIQRVCERVFLEAFMRRDFSELENRLCSDIFERKIEAQLNYMRYVMLERGIY